MLLETSALVRERQCGELCRDHRVAWCAPGMGLSLGLGMAGESAPAVDSGGGTPGFFQKNAANDFFTKNPANDFFTIG